MEGALVKMSIYSFEDPKCTDPPKDVFETKFNPKQYTVSHSVDYCNEEGVGNDGGTQRFRGGKPKEQSFEFLIDGTGVSVGIFTLKPIVVQKEVDKFLKITREYVGEIHRPPYLILSWGKHNLKCVFKYADVTYTQFNPDGSPLRAKINATFIEFRDQELQEKQKGNKSPDLTRIVTVKDGDTLPMIAKNIYGKASFLPGAGPSKQVEKFQEPPTRVAACVASGRKQLTELWQTNLISRPQQMWTCHPLRFTPMGSRFQVSTKCFLWWFRSL